MNELIGLRKSFLNQLSFSDPQMAASSEEGHHNDPNKRKKFTWGYGKNEYWKNVKVHPESGCSMVDTDITHPDTNPCATERKLSLTCLEKGHGKDGCQHYFENYRNCVKFWRQVVRERRATGKEPALPPPDLREQIKKEFLKREFHSLKGH